MSKGVLIFAHNNRDIDYGLLSLISGGLAKKYLKVPVTLVTDRFTINWSKESQIYDKMESIFDRIIEIDKPVTDNTRRLYDGLDHKIVPFTNTNRPSAWEITPYDTTLLLDSDFLIFSNRLGNYWNIDSDVMIANSMNDISGNHRIGYHDRYVSDTGVHMYWATTVMFKKNQESKLFFETVEYVKNNYQYYSDLFRFSNRQYRNDIAFSIAKHILNGFETSKNFDLPSVLTVQDKDILYDVKDDEKLIFLVSSQLEQNYCLTSFNDLDVHIMNKQSIVRNKDKLLRLL
jgi:hypothetical protein